MLSKKYLETAEALLRAAQTMTDPRIASQLRTLAEDYEQRAERASQTDAASASSRSAARVQRRRSVAGQGPLRLERAQAPSPQCANVRWSRC